MPVRPDQVILTSRALRLCEELGVDPDALQAARAYAYARLEEGAWVAYRGTLPPPNGRTVEFFCGPSAPERVATFRIRQ